MIFGVNNPRYRHNVSASLPALPAKPKRITRNPLAKSSRPMLNYIQTENENRQAFQRAVSEYRIALALRVRREAKPTARRMIRRWQDGAFVTLAL